MNCICGKKFTVVLIDLERKADGKVIENVTAEYCDECDTYYINSGGISFE
jgi:hypothetical protein